MTNLDKCSIAPVINAPADVAHIDSLNNSLHNLQELTVVSYVDPYLEANYGHASLLLETEDGFIVQY